MDARNINYPVLCFTKKVGFCIVRSAEELEKCNGILYSRGRFYEGLRVIDERGTSYEIIKSTIRHPKSKVGIFLVKLFDLSLLVCIEMKQINPISLKEIKENLEYFVRKDPESFEEFSSINVDDWIKNITESESVKELMQKIINL
jgi:hypothetical protein